MRRHRTPFLFLALLALAACGQDPGADDNRPGPAADFSFNRIAAAPANSVAETNVAMPAEEMPASETQPLIPAGYHGEWDTSAANCSAAASETRLHVGGYSLRFHESEALVRKVEEVSERIIDVSAEYRSEGQVWQDERRFSLSRDQDSLTITGDGSGLVRRRCGEG